MNLKSKLPPRFQKYASLGVIPKLFLLPFALFFVLAIFVARPIVQIKIFKVNPWRLGHLGIEVELARLNAIHQSNVKKSFVVFYFPDRKPANQFLCDFWQRSLPSIEGMWGWMVYEIAHKISKNNLTVKPTLIDFHGLFETYPSNLQFTHHEERSGEKFLEEID